MIYMPVCGADDQGSRKTYASDCSACADTNVVGYEDGKCVVSDDSGTNTDKQG